MAISDDQRRRIKELISEHHLAFAAEVLGTQVLSRQDFDRLVRTGFITDGAVGHAVASIPAAFVQGRLAKTDMQMARMKPETFWEFMDVAPAQFSEAELDAIEAARTQIGHCITNIGMNLISDFEQATAEEAAKIRHYALSTVQHEIGLGIARRKSNEQIQRRLEKKLGASERDWTLVVRTELHNAQEHGKALAIARAGADPFVYKVPRADACRFCRLLYLVGNRPRIFRLSTLIKNGTNVGRKANRPSTSGKGATEWKPVVGCTHPACQCELFELPEGRSFNDQGKLVIKKAVADDLADNLKALLSHRCSA